MNYKALVIFSLGALGALGFLACAGSVLAESPQKQNGGADTLAAFGAVFEPILKMPAGAARTERACKDVEKLKATARAIRTSPPQGSPIDPMTWKSDVETVGLGVRDLGDSCKAPGQKRKDVLGNITTADKDIDGLKQCWDAVVSETKPRTLTPAMKSFDQVLRKAVADKPKHKQTCKNSPELTRLVTALESPPPGVDKAKWGDLYLEVHRGISDLHGFYCGKASGDDGNLYDDGLDKAHQKFVDMVLLLPVDK